MSALALLVLVALQAPAPQEASPDDLRKLVDRLDADDIRVRGKAEEEILSRWKEWQETDLDALAASRDRSRETAERVKALVDRIRIRQVVGETLLKSIEGIEQKLLGRDEDALVELLTSFALWREKQSVPMADLANVLRWVEQNRASPRVQETLQKLAEAGLKADPKALVAQLRDPLTYRRAQAAFAILVAGDRSLAPDLVPLLKDPSVDVRQLVFRALLRFRARELAGPIGGFLSDRDSVVRSDAARLLARLGARNSVPLIAGLLKDPLPAVRAEALRALADLRVAVVEDAVLDRLSDVDLSVRVEASRTLAALKAKGLAKRLQPLWTSGKPGLRSAALMAMAEAGDPEGIPLCLEALQDAEADVRWMGARGLGRLGARAEAAKLLPLLASPDEWTRVNAAVALGKIGSVAEIDAVAALLKDPNATVRAAAAEALGRMGAVGKSDDLLAALKDPAGHLKQSALWALARLPAPADPAAVVALLGDSAPEVRAGAIEVVQAWRLQAQRPALEALLRDKFHRVRLAAGEALLALGGDGALETVLPLLDDEFGGVRGRIAVAITQTAAASDVRGLAKSLVPRLRRLEWDRSWEAALAASVGLVFLGDKQNKEILDVLEELSFGTSDIGLKLAQDFCWALVRKLEPKSASALTAEKKLESPLASMEDVAALVKSSGLSLVLPPGSRLSGNLAAQLPVSAIQVLRDRMVPYGIVVEGSSVRLGAMDEVLERWRARIK